jgi:hypothetical protein
VAGALYNKITYISFTDHVNQRCTVQFCSWAPLTMVPQIPTEQTNKYCRGYETKLVTMVQTSSFQSAQHSYWQLPKDDSGSHRVKIADFMHSENAASNRNTENNFPSANQPYTVNECGAYYQPVQGHTFVSQAIFTSMQEASEMSAQKSTSVWKSTSMQTSSWGSLKIKIAYCIYKTVNKVTQTPTDEGSVYSTQHCTMTPAATCTSTRSSKTVFWNRLFQW